MGIFDFLKRKNPFEKSNKLFGFKLSSGWVQINNPFGPITFSNKGDKCALQFSIRQYKGDLNYEALESLSTEVGLRRNWNPSDSGKGECLFGIYSYTTFTNIPDIGYFRVYFLSNGYDLIMATYNSKEEPDKSQLTDIQFMVDNIFLKQ